MDFSVLCQELLPNNDKVVSSCFYYDKAQLSVLCCVLNNMFMQRGMSVPDKSCVECDVNHRTL